MTQPYPDAPAGEYPAGSPSATDITGSLRPEVLNYAPITGTLRPQPQSREQAIGGYNYAMGAGMQLRSALDEYFNVHGGAENYEEKDGKWYRVVPGGYDSASNEEKKPQLVLDNAATKLAKGVEYAEADVKALDKMLSKGGIFAAVNASVGGSGGGRSGPSIDELRSSEARRQYLDFIDRAKSLYGLEDEEQAWSMRADDQNIANKKAAMQGQLNWDRAPMYSNTRPFNERLSDIVRPTVPAFIPPDYRLNDQVGLPGGGGFDYPRMQGEGLPDFTKGYASGTGTLPRSDGAIPPDIEWMIGFNPLAAHPGGPFDPTGKQLRGFKDRGGVR